MNYYYYYTLSPVTGIFSMVLLLYQQRSPSLRLQVSAGSPPLIFCNVASIAVVRSDSIECFPVMASTFFFNSLLIFRWLQ